MKRQKWLGMAALTVIVTAGWLSMAKAETSEDERWYASGGLGYILHEGDFPVRPGGYFIGRVGFEYSEDWSLQGYLMFGPEFEERMQTDPVTLQVGSLLEERVGAGVHDASMIGGGIEALYHLTRWERFDPFFGLGLGFSYYDQPVMDTDITPNVRLGGGFMYHFNDEWAFRFDARAVCEGENTAWYGTFDAGIVYSWGHQVPDRFIARGGELDSDGEGLFDEEEIRIGTNPYNPDTDGDGLTDYEEVRTYKTNPVNPDTDGDGLTDYEEVRVYMTDPLVPDTDNGGVWDGYEVLVDGTDPLDPKDDLLLFDLNIEFDDDKSDIRPQYFPDLDAIVRVLQHHPSSTTRIEGHADRRRTSVAAYNMALSKRRAEAVMQYLETRGGISAERMDAVGHGFNWPKAANDPIRGNQLNRRVEVYIRRDGQIGAGRPLTGRDGARIPRRNADDTTPWQEQAQPHTEVDENVAAPAQPEALVTPPK